MKCQWPLCDASAQVEFTVGPDLPDAGVWWRTATTDQIHELPRGYACKEHVELVRRSMEERLMPRASAYHEHRPL